MSLPLWPHQEFGIKDVQEALRGGAKRICLTSPTGGGKTRIATELIQEWQAENLEVTMYTNRRMLFQQTMAVLDSAGIKYGIRASGYKTKLLAPVQIVMTQTEGSQVLSRGRRELHKCHRAIFDEAHEQAGGTMQQIMQQIVDNGGAYVGITATPLEIGSYYDELIVAGTNSELRTCGALVMAETFGPDEPDLRDIKNYKIGEDLTEANNVKAIMRPGVFGRVFDNYKRLNPHQKPTILFGPDVAGSIWFAEEFTRAGVNAAHIDGDVIWHNGRCYPATQEAREDILERSRNGEIKVVCNRFVLRAGIDCPWLEHCIFATVFGALTSFLQSGGRILRQYFIDGVPQLKGVTIQDHGGNWWRFGSLNSDRLWNLNDTNKSMAEARKKQMMATPEMQPITCPRCSKIRLSGPQCPNCGWSYQKRSRIVVQTDGALRRMAGDFYKPRKVTLKSDTQKEWDKYYWKAKKGKRGMTFAQLEGMFYKEKGYWPPRTIANMPKDSLDWDRRVRDVEYSALNKKPQMQKDPDENRAGQQRQQEIFSDQAGASQAEGGADAGG